MRVHSDFAFSGYAGFWIRFWALFIDSLIMGAAAIVLSFLVVAILSAAAAGVAMVVLYILAFVGQWLYFALQESGEHQATIGKRAVGVYVTDIRGERLTFARATGRYLAKILSGIPLDIGYMLAGWTKKKQALHDMIAGTYVCQRHD